MRNLKYFSVLLLISNLVLAVFARAATYNFYFNNTEQGANSTASPSVTVSDGKVVKTTPLEPTAAADGVSSTAVLPVEPTLATTAHIKQDSLVKINHNNPHFRFALSGLYMPASQSLVTVDQTHNRFVTGNTASGATLGVSYFPVSALGLSVYGGGYKNSGDPGTFVSFYGADVEIVPYRISVGKFENMIEPALLVGASTIPQDTTTVNQGVITGKAVTESVVPMAGARLSLHLNSHLGLTASARLDIDRRSFMTAEAGIVVRL